MGGWFKFKLMNAKIPPQEFSILLCTFTVTEWQSIKKQERLACALPRFYKFCNMDTWLLADVQVCQYLISVCCPAILCNVPALPKPRWFSKTTSCWSLLVYVKWCDYCCSKETTSCWSLLAYVTWCDYCCSKVLSVSSSCTKWIEKEWQKFER